MISGLANQAGPIARSFKASSIGRVTGAYFSSRANVNSSPKQKKPAGSNKEVKLGPAKLPKVIDETAKMQRITNSIMDKKETLGFVPTMGALHMGHLKLVERAKKENDRVIMSIFVNPTQFGPNEDFNKYPRQLEKDVQMLAGMGVDYVFAPSSPAQIYSKYDRSVVSTPCTDLLDEGKCRPGHLSGVATVVLKLFNIVRPTKAYFGQKDALQCVVVRRLAEDFFLPTKVVVCDTIREKDGLAMSSRNVYMNPEERKASGRIYMALSKGKKVFDAVKGKKGATVPAANIRDAVIAELKLEPRFHTIQYVSIGCPHTMSELETVKGEEGAIVSLALKMGNVRLIDNFVL